MRDGKDKFYRSLELDEESRKILKWFRNTKKELMDDLIKYTEEETEC